MTEAREVMRLHRETGVPILEARAALREAGDYQTALQVLLAAELDPAYGDIGPQEQRRRDIGAIRRRTGLRHDEAEDLLTDAAGSVSRALRLTDRLSAAEARRRLSAGSGLSNVEIHGLKLRGDYAALRFNAVRLVDPVFSEISAMEIAFSSCELVNPVFSHLDVAGDVVIKSSQANVITIRSSVIGGTLSLPDSEIDYLTVSDVSVGSRIRAWDARVARWMTLKQVRVHGVADFRAMHCGEGVRIEDCQFEDAVLFRGTRVGGRFDLSGSRFEDIVDLQRAKIEDFAYLEDVVLGPRQSWRFANMRGTLIEVHPKQISGRLASEQEGDYVTAAVEYSMLRRVWNGLDRHGAEDWAFHEFKVALRRSKRRSWKRPWSKIPEFFEWLLLDKGCGYGTNPFRALYTAAVVVAMFAVLYAGGIESFDTATGRIDDPSSASTSDRLVFGLLTSASVFAANFEQINLASGWVVIALVLEAGLGLLLFGLFVVAFSRKVIR